MLKSALISSSLLVVVAGCMASHAGSAAAPAMASPPPAAPTPVGLVDQCPMHVAGTQVALSDTPTGVAIDFTTTGDVGELRARVHHMASMHDQMSGGHDPGIMNDSSMMMPPSHAAANDIDGGAHLVLIPVDPAQLDALRATAHRHVDMMRGGECPMMKMNNMNMMGDDHASHHGGGM